MNDSITAASMIWRAWTTKQLPELAKILGLDTASRGAVADFLAACSEALTGGSRRLAEEPPAPKEIPSTPPEVPVGVDPLLTLPAPNIPPNPTQGWVRSLSARDKVAIIWHLTVRAGLDMPRVAERLGGLHLSTLWRWFGAYQDHAPFNQLLTPDQAAKRLGCSRSAFVRAARAGKIVNYCVGRRIFTTAAAVQDSLKSGQVRGGRWRASAGHDAPDEELRRGRVTDAERVEVVRLLREGCSAPEIQRALHRPRGTVHHIIRQLQAQQEGASPVKPPQVGPVIPAGNGDAPPRTPGDIVGRVHRNLALHDALGLAHTLGCAVKNPNRTGELVVFPPEAAPKTIRHVRLSAGRKDAPRKLLTLLRQVGAWRQAGTRTD